MCFTHFLQFLWAGLNIVSNCMKKWVILCKVVGNLSIWFGREFLGVFFWTAMDSEILRKFLAKPFFPGTIMFYFSVASYNSEL